MTQTIKLERVKIISGSAKTLIRIKANNGQELTITQTELENLIWATHGDELAKEWVLRSLGVN